MVSEEHSATAASVPPVIDTSRFSKEDFNLFLESSAIIHESRRKRNSFKKSASKPHKTREEVFEVSNIDDEFDLLCNNNDNKEITENIKNLSADIETLFQSFSNDQIGVISVDIPCTPPATTKVEVCHLPKIVESHRKILNTPKWSSDDETVRKPIPTPRKSLVSEEILENFHGKLSGEKQDIEKEAERTTVFMSIKDRISYFNKLATKPNRKLPKPDANAAKMTLRTPSKVFSQKPSKPRQTTCGKLEIALKRDLVKSKIQQFENNVQSEASDPVDDFKPPPVRIPKSPMPKRNLVQKIRTYFENSLKLKTTKNTERNIPVPPKKPARTHFAEPAGATPSVSSTLSIKSSPRKSSCPSPEYASVETSRTNLPQLGYDPFAESEKCLRNLGEIASTIKSLREQGIVDISDDLLEMFRKSLVSARSRLARQPDSRKILDGEVPTKVSNSPKCEKNAANTSKREMENGTIFPDGVERKSTDVELSYNRFVYSLKRTESNTKEH